MNGNLIEILTNDNPSYVFDNVDIFIHICLHNKVKSVVNLYNDNRERVQICGYYRYAHDVTDYNYLHLGFPIDQYKVLCLGVNKKEYYGVYYKHPNMNHFI